MARAGAFLAKVVEAQVSPVSPVTPTRVARAGVSVARAIVRVTPTRVARAARAGF